MCKIKDSLYLPLNKIPLGHCALRLNHLPKLCFLLPTIKIFLTWNFIGFFFFWPLEAKTKQNKTKKQKAKKQKQKTSNPQILRSIIYMIL